MALNVNSDNRVADLLNDLRRHMKACRSCQSAVKAKDYDLLCSQSRELIITTAHQFDTVIPRRLKAHRTGSHVFFACPDIGAHGKTWAATAEPVAIIGIQESLF